MENKDCVSDLIENIKNNEKIDENVFSQIAQLNEYIYIYLLRW
jgi:hypothetical protein